MFYPTTTRHHNDFHHPPASSHSSKGADRSSAGYPAFCVPPQNARESKPTKPLCLLKKSIINIPSSLAQIGPKSILYLGNCCCGICLAIDGSLDICGFIPPFRCCLDMSRISNASTLLFRLAFSFVRCLFLFSKCAMYSVALARTVAYAPISTCPIYSSLQPSSP